MFVIPNVRTSTARSMRGARHSLSQSGRQSLLFQMTLNVMELGMTSTMIARLSIRMWPHHGVETGCTRAEEVPVDNHGQQVQKTANEVGDNFMHVFMMWVESAAGADFEIRFIPVAWR